MKVLIDGTITVKDNNLSLIEELEMDLGAFSYLEHELLSVPTIKNTVVIVFNNITIDTDYTKLTKDMLDFISYLDKSYNNVKTNIKLNNTLIVK